MSETVLRLELVSKLFGSARAVDRVELEVQRGHVFTLLGPSGCGKTTTLRMVAGLERPDEGRIIFAGRPVADAGNGLFVPPHKRQMGMVFQSYAIWPHMTVFENVAYPLELRGMPKKVIREKVERVLDLVGMAGLADRPAPLLSGGQQQRVALCRALVYEPDLLLLDEPFSNLDAKLRHHMRVEVKLLQQRLGITVLFVTHDQLEALSMSDQIGVMNLGKLEQVGSPSELYDTPASPFVRDFLGQTVNLLGQVVRPEDVVVKLRNGSTGQEPNTVLGIVETLLFTGDSYEARITLENGEPVLLSLPRSGGWAPGQAVVLSWPPERTHAWPV
jgi:ABC-type Fe3+/spermidine/putrescine transport system ATPase subunit